MALQIWITAGPHKGKKFDLAAGLGIGRTKGEIRIDDGKVSSLHAFVVETDGRFVLNDNGSKNGIRFENERVMTLPLKDGVVFQIGNTQLEVVKVADRPSAAKSTRKKVATPAPRLPDAIDDEDVTGVGQSTAHEFTHTAANQVAAAKSKPAAAVKKAEPAPAPKPQPKPAPRWNDVLSEFTAQVLSEIKDQPKAVAALTPAVKLTFLGGVQAETEWTLGYGPRRIGSQSVDLPIFEPGAPDICFEIIPSPEGVTFRTNYPKDVTLNGQPVRVKPLAKGDMIVVGTTRIEVDLLP